MGKFTLHNSEEITKRLLYRNLEAPTTSTETANDERAEVMDEAHINQLILREKVTVQRDFTEYQTLKAKENQEGVLDDNEYAQFQRIQYNMFQGLQEAAALSLPQDFDNIALRQAIFGPEGLIEEWDIQEATRDLKKFMDDTDRIANLMQQLDRDMENGTPEEQANSIAKAQEELSGEKLTDEQKDAIAKFQRAMKDLPSQQGATTGVDALDQGFEWMDDKAQGIAQTMRKPGSVLLKGGAVIAGACAALGVIANIMLPALSGGIAGLKSLPKLVTNPRQFAKDVRAGGAFIWKNKMTTIKRVGGMAVIGAGAYVLASGKPYETMRGWTHSGQEAVANLRANTPENQLLDLYKDKEGFNEKQETLAALMRAPDEELSSNYDYLNNINSQEDINSLRTFLQSVNRETTVGDMREPYERALIRVSRIDEVLESGQQLKNILGIPEDKFKLGDLVNHLIQKEGTNWGADDRSIVQAVGEFITGSVPNWLSETFGNPREWDAVEIFWDDLVNKTPTGRTSVRGPEIEIPEAPESQTPRRAPNLEELRETGLQMSDEITDTQQWVGHVRNLLANLRRLNNPSLGRE